MSASPVAQDVPTTVAVDAPEQVVTRRGRHSGQMITASIHSTRLGPALGGCRIQAYPSWQDGCADAVRLSAAMTEKATLAGLGYGGGKTVVSLDGAFRGPLTGAARAAVLADVGDLVEGFGGAYVTGPDVGSGPADMAVIGERTAHVLCRPEELGGSGDSSRPTALGVAAAIDAVRDHLWPGRDLSDLRFAVHGLGHVGTLVASRLAAAGARLVVSDVDETRRAAATSWDAEWVSPDEAITADVDVVVPCAIGGILTSNTVASLRAAAVVGAANNQIDRTGTADLLHARGIVWCPDTVVSAGGIIAAVARERDGLTAAAADARVRAIGPRLAGILAASAAAGTAPLHEARRLAQARLGGRAARG